MNNLTLEEILELAKPFTYVFEGSLAQVKVSAIPIQDIQEFVNSIAGKLQELETCYSIPGGEGSSELSDIADDMNDGEVVELWEWKSTKAKLVNFKLINGELEKIPEF